MSVASIIMMIIALTVVWGGMGAAIVHLQRHPDEVDD